MKTRSATAYIPQYPVTVTLQLQLGEKVEGDAVIFDRTLRLGVPKPLCGCG